MANLSKLNAEHNDTEGHRGKQWTIAQYTKSLAEATALRLELQKENEQAMAEAKEGEEATTFALHQLKNQKEVPLRWPREATMGSSRRRHIG